MHIENGAVFYDKPFVCTLEDWRTANGDCMLIVNSSKGGVVIDIASVDFIADDVNYVAFMRDYYKNLDRNVKILQEMY